MEPSARRLDDNGYITIENNPISRVGVFPYLGKYIDREAEPSKVYQVYRPAEELSNSETIESFKLLPITIDHEMIGDPEMGYTPPEQKGVHGTIGEKVEYKDGVLFATLKIFSQALGNLIKAGRRDISLGYKCVYEKSAGVFNGVPYDYIQRRMRGNHMANVSESRCDVAVLDHHLAFDHFDLALDTKELDMADEPKKDDEAKKAMTLEEITSMLEDVMPKIQKLIAAASGEAKEDKVEETLDGDDKDDEDKKKAEDEDKEKDKKEGMDSVELKSLRSEVNALKSQGVKSILSEVSQRDALVRDLSSFVGAFDASDKTLAEVAVYGVEQLGLKTPKGTEHAALSAYFTGCKASRVGFALDSKPRTGSKLLKRINAQA